jgi:hypothetical protein
MPANLPSSCQCSLPLSNGPTVAQFPVSTGCATLTQNDAETQDRYWSKVYLIRAKHSEKLNALHREISRLLTMNWDDSKRAQLTTILRKMMLMQQILNTSPESNRFGTNLDTINAVELQLIYWINQLQNFQNAH